MAYCGLNLQLTYEHTKQKPKINITIRLKRTGGDIAVFRPDGVRQNVRSQSEERLLPRQVT